MRAVMKWKRIGKTKASAYVAVVERRQRGSAALREACGSGRYGHGGRDRRTSSRKRSRARRCLKWGRSKGRRVCRKWRARPIFARSKRKSKRKSSSSNARLRRAYEEYRHAPSWYATRARWVPMGWQEFQRERPKRKQTRRMDALMLAIEMAGGSRARG